jgi:RimJ/RimL family protein N-acetyltransferase
MSHSSTISLVPLTIEHHMAALQTVYEAAPSYWALYGLLACPPTQAEHDLQAAGATPGRSIMGMVRRTAEKKVQGLGELVGLVDFRLHWPGQHVVYIGMVLVVEALQRQGIGRQSWHLLEPWLSQTAKMHKARVGVEQFNPGALKFFEHLGFHLTGQTDRHRVGAKLVRLLYLEKEW